MSFYTRQADELRRRGRVRADHARWLATRLDRRAIMRRAWALARQGAARFGGKVRAYFAEALRLVWAEVKARLAVARGMAEDRFALTVTGLLVLRETQAAAVVDVVHGQLELALEG
jgi:hypothetical protein